MKFKYTLLSAAILAATSLTVAQAQTGTGSTGPNTSTNAKDGQKSTPNQDKGAMPRPSTESRAAVKADTAAAKAAASVPMGERSTPNQDKGSKPMASEKARADVKAEATADKKAGGTTKGGQESVKDQNKGGVKP